MSRTTTRRHRRGAGGSRSIGHADELDLSLPSDAQDSKPPAETQESASGTLVFKGSPVENSSSISQGAAAAPGSSKVCILQQLLGGLPSPARASQGAPCGPPAHAPAAIAAPTVPPPPLAPAPVYSAFERQCEPPQVPAPLEVASVSYRDRLRAGGHGAFQRAICAGLMPKGMKQDQEWSSNQTPIGQNTFSQQVELQSSLGMQCPTPTADGQQIWNSLNCGDFWGYQMNQPQTPQSMQQVSPQCDMQSYYGMQQCDMQPMQMPPMVQGNNSPTFHMQANTPSQLQQIPSPSMQGLQLPTPQMFMPTSSGESTPSEVDRCMAIAMHPQASQFDRDAVAAQLKAVADCQCYED